jgi:hypothetical protein
MKHTEPFKVLQKDLKGYLPVLQNAAETIITQEVSSYPIFVVHQITVDIGINIVDKEKVKGNWSINASALEEFVAKQIIASDKVDEFRLVFRNHPGELCLFVLNDSGANFVFMPL